jgi:hypothetical protein
MSEKNSRRPFLHRLQPLDLLAQETSFIYDWGFATSEAATLLREQADRSWESGRLPFYFCFRARKVILANNAASCYRLASF